jgi:hypothetical protein
MRQKDTFQLVKGAHLFKCVQLNRVKHVKRTFQIVKGACLFKCAQLNRVKRVKRTRNFRLSKARAFSYVRS